MNEVTWGEDNRRQKELARLEEHVVLGLLEEIHELEIDRANERSLAEERRLLKTHLVSLAAEHARLDAESDILESDSRMLRRTEPERTRGLRVQLERVQALLRDWRGENGRGHRRRLRDHVWLDALLLEKNRLERERRRLKEQACR